MCSTFLVAPHQAPGEHRALAQTEISSVVFWKWERSPWATSLLCHKAGRRRLGEEDERKREKIRCKSLINAADTL